MTQSEIDNLLEKYNDKSSYIEESYQNLICIHCGKIIRCFDTTVHCFLSSTKCRNKQFTCTFVSASWLKSKKEGQYCWNRKGSLEPDVKIQKVPRGIDGEALSKKRIKKKYIRSPNEKIIYSCSIWNNRDS